MKFYTSFFILLISCYSFAQTADVTAKINYYTEKANLYLDKEKALSGFYSIDKEGIKIYASVQNKALKKAEFTLGWNELEQYKKQFKNCQDQAAFEVYKTGKCDPKYPCFVKEHVAYIDASPEKKLQGMRIAIDPGHIANDFAMADLEKKHIKFRATDPKHPEDSVEIAEGMLTYATAKLLKEKLEAQGAQTFVTRVNGASAFGKTYGQWKKDDMKNAIDSLSKAGELKAAQKNYFLSAKAQDRDIFRILFKDLELAKRAEIINNYQPDFTIIIHYNVDETNLEWTKPTAKNKDMTFVGGAFMKNDLSGIKKRFEFLRLLITDDLEQSIALSSNVVNSFEKKLNVPTANIADAKYLIQGCLSTKAKGVYCRNLQLTRYVHGPLVYGETLFQDNISEAHALNKEEDKTKNERVQQVAEAYYQGVLNYVQSRK